MPANDMIILANAHKEQSRWGHLQTANAKLDTLRLYLRLAHRFNFLTDGQYRHVSAMVAEIGRLLGGWMRQTQKTL